MASPEDIARTTKKLATIRVLVGIPSDAASRTLTMSQEAANMVRGGSAAATPPNAALGYIHEFGSPARNIPARPFLLPGVVDSKDRWTRYLRQAAQAALDGNDAVMDKAFDAAGNVAMHAVKAKITQGIPPPIKPATMAARARHRGRAAKRAKKRAAYRGFYERYEAGIETSAKGAGITPLIDTAQLINSIVYVVEKK